MAKSHPLILLATDMHQAMHVKDKNLKMNTTR